MLVGVGTLAAALGPAIIGLVAFLLVQHVHDPRHLSIQAQLGLALVSDAPVILFLVPVLPWLARGGLADVGIRRPTAGEIRVGLIGAVVMWAVVEPAALLMQLITHHPPTEAAISLLRGVKGPLETFEFALVGAVVAPIAEELAFRAFLFRAIERYSSFWVAALLSGLCFGVVHVSAFTLADLLGLGVPLALGGVVLAVLYARTRCLWTNIIAHASFNSVSLVAVFVFHQTP